MRLTTLKGASTDRFSPHDVPQEHQSSRATSWPASIDACSIRQAHSTSERRCGVPPPHTVSVCLLAGHDLSCVRPIVPADDGSTMATVASRTGPAAYASARDAGVAIASRGRASGILTYTDRATGSHWEAASKVHEWQ